MTLTQQGILVGFVAATPHSKKPRRWACDNFKPADDPSFCANCHDIASSHRGPTPGAPRSFRISIPLKVADDRQSLTPLQRCIAAKKLLEPIYGATNLAPLGSPISKALDLLDQAIDELR